MDQITFLGVSKSHWDLINSFSNWLSAIGTIAAVIVSLWLASRAWRLQAKVSVGHRIIIQTGARGEYPEIMVFQIVNTGERPIRVKSIGWRTGIFRWKRFAPQMHDQQQSSPLPIELSHGQEASWIVPLNPGDDGWMIKFTDKMLKPRLRYACATLRAEFHTSIDHTFSIKPEAGLLRRIRQACITESSE